LRLKRKVRFDNTVMADTNFLQILETISNETKIGVLFGLLAAVVVAKYFLGGSNPTTTTKKRPPVLSPTEYRSFKLKDKKIVSHNTRLFRFALPNENDILGLPIGQHLSFSATIDSKPVFRSYTPVTSDDEVGYFDLIVKVYDKGVMSKHMDSLKLGDTIDVKGPKGKFLYTPNMKKNIGMLAGGTGITPMLQIIKAILKNPKDKTQVSLIFGNVTVDDMLLREELDIIARQHPDQFKVFHVLNSPPPDWTFGSGFITQSIIQAHIQPPSDDGLVICCGPPLMNQAMTTNLQKIGYSESQFFIF